MKDAGQRELKRKVIVCGSCLQASCWQGEFMCDASWDLSAGTIEKTIEELKALGLENASYWSEPK